MGGLIWGAWDCRERSKPCSNFFIYVECIVCFCNPANRAFLSGKSFSTSVVVRVPSISHRWFVYVPREKRT